jgi:hypothetical protein
MMKKSLLTLLLALNCLALNCVSEAHVNAETSIPKSNISDISEKIDDFIEDLIPENLKEDIVIIEKELESTAYKTILRCIALLAAKNIADRYFSTGSKTNKFDASKYADITLKALVDKFLVKTSTNKFADIAEWTASEFSLVTDVTSATDDAKAVKGFALGNKKDNQKKLLKMLMKAASRKQLFLPKESEAYKMMRTPVASVTLTCCEKAEFNTRAITFATAGMISTGFAKDILLGIAVADSTPESLRNFMSTDLGMKFCEDILSQFIEDCINQAAVSEIINPKAVA